MHRTRSILITEGPGFNCSSRATFSGGRIRRISRTTVEMDDMFVVMPSMSLPIKNVPLGRDWESLGKSLPDGFRYSSSNNPQWLTIEQIKNMIAPIEAAYELGKLE